MDLIYFSDKMEVDSEEEDRKSLERAIFMAEGKTAARSNYIQGPEGYEEWANTLINFELDLKYFGNAYLGDCYWEGRSMAATYMKRLAVRYSTSPQATPLIKAAEAYGIVESLLKQFTILFPFITSDPQDNFTEENRLKGAELLMKAKKSEIRAIQSLKDALHAWLKN